MSPDPEPRKRAEAELRQLADQPRYGVAVLSLVASADVDPAVRQAASVNLKNHIKYRWNPNELDVMRMGELKLIEDAEKEEIKANIVNLMLSSPPRIQAQISDALSNISKHDFPAKWANLLPELVQKLNSQDYSVVNGILEAANSIFKRFQFQFKSQELYEELKYCLDMFVNPMLALFLRTGELVSSNGHNPPVLKQLIESQRLMCEIFYSLNYQELPEVFEDKLKEWMGEFHRYLTYENPFLEEKDNDKESVLNELKAAICRNINLYMEKNEEEFQGFLSTFVKDVWDLLMKVGLTSKHDQLAITAITFLTTVSTSVHHRLFEEAQALKVVCEGIVIPNLQFREEDEELFEMNFLEYIRRDMEGSDSDTRRRIACELVKGLASHYEQLVTHICSQHIMTMLGEYAKNPDENWKAKDCAIYLVVALAVRTKTVSAGATSVNELVNVGDFFQNSILPEMVTPDVNERPVLKADALKFVTTFRSQLPKAKCLELFPSLIRLLGAESNVVHSYAANCIERILVVKDEGKPRFSSSDLQPFGQQLLWQLFGALKLPESNDNQYIMKCVMRVVSIADLGPFSAKVVQELAGIITEVCKNPRNPTFTHYVFEALAALVKKATTDPTNIVAFEGSIFPVLETVYVNDVAEFAPYCFQILALLVETRKAPLPNAYMELFPILVSPDQWERPANVPALVRVLQAYLEKASKAIVAANRVSAVLGVFHKLIASKHTDHHGFYVLNTTIEYLTVEELTPFLKQIWSLLFHRLQGSRTPKFVRGLLVFMALFVAKFGIGPTISSVNLVQEGIFFQLIDPVWVSTLPNITGVIEPKLCAVAATKLLTECQELQVDSNLPLWGRLLNATVTMAVRPEEERVADEGEGEGEGLEEAFGGYQTSFAQLQQAGKREEDPLPNIRDPKEFLARSLGGLLKQSQGKFLGVLQTALPPENVEALSQLCVIHNVTFS